MITCNRCNREKLTKEYSVKKNGNIYKSCDGCRGVDIETVNTDIIEIVLLKKMGVYNIMKNRDIMNTLMVRLDCVEQDCENIKKMNKELENKVVNFETLKIDGNVYNHDIPVKHLSSSEILFEYVSKNNLCDLDGFNNLYNTKIGPGEAVKSFSIKKNRKIIKVLIGRFLSKKYKQLNDNKASPRIKNYMSTNDLINNSSGQRCLYPGDFYKYLPAMVIDEKIKILSKSIESHGDKNTKCELIGCTFCVL